MTKKEKLVIDLFENLGGAYFYGAEDLMEIEKEKKKAEKILTQEQIKIIDNFAVEWIPDVSEIAKLEEELFAELEESGF